MRGMQEYAAHAAQNARGDLIHERVAHGFMHTMPPPDKHVRFLQNFIREPAAVFVIVLIHRFRFDPSPSNNSRKVSCRRAVLFQNFLRLARNPSPYSENTVIFI